MIILLGLNTCDPYATIHGKITCIMKYYMYSADKYYMKYYMYSAADVNRFEMKDTCIEFVINVSRQGNSGNMKLNLKINLPRLQS